MTRRSSVIVAVAALAVAWLVAPMIAEAGCGKCDAGGKAHVHAKAKADGGSCVKCPKKTTCDAAKTCSVKGKCAVKADCADCKDGKLCEACAKACAAKKAQCAAKQAKSTTCATGKKCDVAPAEAVKTACCGTCQKK